VCSQTNRKRITSVRDTNSLIAEKRNVRKDPVLGLRAEVKIRSWGAECNAGRRPQAIQTHIQDACIPWYQSLCGVQSPARAVSCARHVAVWKTSNRAKLDAGANKSQYNNGYRFRHSSKLGPVGRKGLTWSANPQLQETNSHARILFKRFLNALKLLRISPRKS
jgi:hypothetical protein